MHICQKYVLYNKSEHIKQAHSSYHNNHFDYLMALLNNIINRDFKDYIGNKSIGEF